MSECTSSGGDAQRFRRYMVVLLAVTILVLGFVEGFSRHSRAFASRVDARYRGSRRTGERCRPSSLNRLELLISV